MLHYDYDEDIVKIINMSEKEVETFIKEKYEVLGDDWLMGLLTQISSSILMSLIIGSIAGVSPSKEMEDSARVAMELFEQGMNHINDMKDKVEVNEDNIVYLQDFRQ